MTRSVQPEPHAVAIVRQNGQSSASCRASVAVTPVSRQIWWVQVVDGRPQARLHSCEGRSPSLDLVLIRRTWFAGTSRRSMATCPKRPSLRLRTMYETSNRPVRCRTSSLDTKSCHLMCRMRRWRQLGYLLINRNSNLYSVLRTDENAVVVVVINGSFDRDVPVCYQSFLLVVRRRLFPLARLLP